MNASLREALDKSLLGDTGKAIVVAVMQFIGSPGIIPRDLKPVNVFRDGRDHAKIGELGSNRLNDIGLTMTKRVGILRYMAPEMATDDEYSMIVCELLVGEAAFRGALGVLMRKVGRVARPPLRRDMDDTVRGVFSEYWPIDASVLARSK